MMRLVKKEELYPESQAHFPKEGMDADSARFRIGQPLTETNDFCPEGLKATEYFLGGQAGPLRPG
jgi:hypothetical protein